MKAKEAREEIQKLVKVVEDLLSQGKVRGKTRTDTETAIFEILSTSDSGASTPKLNQNLENMKNLVEKLTKSPNKPASSILAQHRKDPPNIAHQKEVTQHRMIEITQLLVNGADLTPQQKQIVEAGVALQKSGERNLAVWKTVNLALYEVKESVKESLKTRDYSNFGSEIEEAPKTMDYSQHGVKGVEKPVSNAKPLPKRPEPKVTHPRVSRILAEKEANTRIASEAAKTSVVQKEDASGPTRSRSNSRS